MQANNEEKMEEYKGFGAFEDEDYRNAGESSKPTTESVPSDEEKKSFDSEGMVDEPAEVDVIGEKTDCYHEDGKITKEIHRCKIWISSFFAIG